MHTKEKILTGLALSLLAFWELSIAEIPLGLFSISHSGQATLFTGIILLKLLVAAMLLSRGLMNFVGKYSSRLKTKHLHLHHHGNAVGTKS